MKIFTCIKSTGDVEVNRAMAGEDKGQKNGAWKEAFNLIVVLGSAVGTALLVVFMMIHYWGPTGQYLLKNTLISPEFLSQLTYREKEESTSSRYVFHRMEFVYPTAEGKWDNSFIDPNNYRAFYRQLSNEKSILEVTPEVVKRFQEGKMMTLMITVKPDSPFVQQVQYRTFQQVQFSPDGDFFRIDLRDDGNGEQWAYFYVSGAATLAKQLLL